MKEFYFERLTVWQESRNFVKQVYLKTIEFPENEKFGLTSQIRRAALSITANIAEGMSRFTEKEKARFISIAYSSGIEVLNFLILANDLDYLTDDNYLKLRTDLEKITNQLNSLYKRFDK
nr:four helix bundle protein [uncultured Flavobacterium sp.]